VESGGLEARGHGIRRRDSGCKQQSEAGERGEKPHDRCTATGNAAGIAHGDPLSRGRSSGRTGKPDVRFQTYPGSAWAVNSSRWSGKLPVSTPPNGGDAPDHQGPTLTFCSEALTRSDTTFDLATSGLPPTSDGPRPRRACGPARSDTVRGVSTAPAARADYPHVRPIPTRWQDNDVYGHVNNVEYYASSTP